jgi:hypothetical protein
LGCEPPPIVEVVLRAPLPLGNKGIEGASRAHIQQGTDGNEAADQKRQVAVATRAQSSGNQQSGEKTDCGTESICRDREDESRPYGRKLHLVRR